MCFLQEKEYFLELQLSKQLYSEVLINLSP